MTGPSYIFLLVASICSILLVLSCMPAKSGQRSPLENVYTVKLLIPVYGNNTMLSTSEIRIGNLAICSNHTGNVHCLITSGRKSEDILSWTSEKSPSETGRTGFAVALGLQKNVFLAIPAVALVLIAVAASCAGLNHCFSSRTSALFRLAASISAVLAAAIMLLDGYASRLAISALQVTNGTSDFKYSIGKVYIGLQWAVFGCCLLATLDLMGSYVRLKRKLILEEQNERSWWGWERPTLPVVASLGDARY